MRILWHLLAVAALGLATSAATAGVAMLEWAEMPDPAAQRFDDPFRDLTPEQYDDLVFSLRLRARLEQDIGSEEERQKWQQLLSETEAALATDGIDIEWLLSQRDAVIQRRTRAMTAGNPQFDGTEVMVSGYAIPAPPDKDGRSIAYLVPKPGMCSHLPPPPPNQMIRVQLPGDWSPDKNHEPVRLTGTLRISPSDHRINVVDGLVPMQATFVLDADTAEPLDWDAEEQSLADQLRAAAHRKTGGAGRGN
ncbi:MAG: DUF3299 domain-containing protein [Ruegeria sp.]